MKHTHTHTHTHRHTHTQTDTHSRTAAGSCLSLEQLHTCMFFYFPWDKQKCAAEAAIQTHYVSIRRPFKAPNQVNKVNPSHPHTHTHTGGRPPPPKNLTDRQTDKRARYSRSLLRRDVWDLLENSSSGSVSANKDECRHIHEKHRWSDGEGSNPHTKPTSSLTPPPRPIPL